MRCPSCGDLYWEEYAGTCKECYEEASETEEELKREIAFLRLPSPDHHLFSSSSSSAAAAASSDVLLLHACSSSADDSSTAPAAYATPAVPAHRIVLKPSLMRSWQRSTKCNISSSSARCLTSKVNSENALVSYAFAHQHNAKQLLEAALSLVLDNMAMLTEHAEYKELVEKDPRFVVEIYETYLARQVNTAFKDMMLQL